MAIRLKILFFALFFAINLVIPQSYGQNILDDFEDEDNVSLGFTENAPQLYPETIKIIAPSKKIFILTNENRSFSKGDFISLLIGNKLVCRALVAKTTDELLSGIKIVKIYDVALWNTLTPNKEVLVLRGDDSYYANLGKAPKEDPRLKNKVNDEEDLFNSTTLNDDDMGFEDNSKRLIKTDNLLSLGIGMLPGKDTEGESTRYTHFNGSWGYQIADNLWAELGAGLNNVADFPSDGLSTTMMSFSAKLKLTFEAPFYSYVMPYVGYQIIQAKSDDAGVEESPGVPSQAELDREVQLLDDLKKSSAIFGVTVLKRIVPGWFIRADLGNDIMSAGLTIEF